MTDSDDILDKADALLVRYRDASGADEDIPLLTDIIAEPCSEVLPAEADTSSRSVPDCNSFPNQNSTALDERVISAATERIASLLDERLLQLTSEIRAFCHSAVVEAIREALDELRKPQSK